MDANEFMMWRAYARVELFGEQRADYRNGILASIYMNFKNRGKGREYQPIDFMPFINQEVKDKSMAKRLKEALGFKRGNS